MKGCAEAAVRVSMHGTREVLEHRATSGSARLLPGLCASELFILHPYH